MKKHILRVYPEKALLAKEKQLAFQLAELSFHRANLDKEAAEMVINRIIDNAAVAVAAWNRAPVASARAMAEAHPKENGASLFGLPATMRFCAEWASFANATAVRELDFHDTYLAADYSHPADNIPALLAVAQQCQKTGLDLLHAILTAYEIQMSLVKSICLHKHKIDHIAHLAPSISGGIGTLLQLSKEVIYQAINQSLHTSCSTRQSRKGEISSWKAFAPAHAGKLAIEAVDRCMRGEKSPSPIYEGEDSVVAWMLDGKDAYYEVFLPEQSEPRKAILESYTKEHSAEYQSQAIIDLAFEVREAILQKTGGDWSLVRKIMLHTSHHTHYVIGTGAKDPQKMNPKANRETLDHSIMYILAVALQDGSWHHLNSYKPERAAREDTIQLWHKIQTSEDQAWTKRYHTEDPKEKAFGGRIEITLQSGECIVAEKAIANAHSLGSNPWQRKNYIQKFFTLTDGIISKKEQVRFLDLVQNLPKLTNKELLHLNPSSDLSALEENRKKGIF
jgi:2-methylcitrate dehydratase